MCGIMVTTKRRGTAPKKETATMTKIILSKADAREIADEILNLRLELLPTCELHHQLLLVNLPMFERTRNNCRALKQQKTKSFSYFLNYLISLF